MRVLHVATRYLRGGSETRIRDFVRSLPEAEHHVVIGADSDPELALFELNPTSLTIVPTLVREPSPISDLRAMRAIGRILAKDRHHLVVTHQSKAGVLGRSAARRAGVPSIHSLSMASFGPGYPKWQNSLFRWLETRLSSATTAYAVVGEDLVNRYAGIGVPKSKLHVIRSGVRLPEHIGTMNGSRLAGRRRYGLPSQRPLVLYLGSLDARKNVMELPAFLSGLIAKDPALRPYLVVAGEGPLFDKLSEELEAAGLGDDAAMLGFVPDPGELLASADALVLLSRTEGVPQVLVQAAAVGTPFVAYEVDGVRELMDLGARGVSIPPGNLNAAVEETAALLRGNGRSDRSDLDLSVWSPESIGIGYRKLVSSVCPDQVLSDHAASGM
jgi:glycosyltransferase involved in cell wall biosynthesis